MYYFYWLIFDVDFILTFCFFYKPEQEIDLSVVLLHYLWFISLASMQNASYCYSMFY